MEHVDAPFANGMRFNDNQTHPHEHQHDVRQSLDNALLEEQSTSHNRNENIRSFDGDHVANEHVVNGEEEADHRHDFKRPDCN